MFKAHLSSFDLYLAQRDDRRYPSKHPASAPITSGPTAPVAEKPKSAALLKAMADIEARFGAKA